MQSVLRLLDAGRERREERETTRPRIVCYVARRTQIPSPQVYCQFMNLIKYRFLKRKRKHHMKSLAAPSPAVSSAMTTPSMYLIVSFLLCSTPLLREFTSLSTLISSSFDLSRMLWSSSLANERRTSGETSERVRDVHIHLSLCSIIIPTASGSSRDRAPAADSP